MPFVNIPDRSAADIVASADINSLMGNSKYNADNLNYLRNGTVGVYDLNIYAGAGLSYANEIDIHTKSNPLTSLGYNLWVGKGTAAPTGTADNDTSIGYNALVNVTHGSKDVAFGNGALHDLTEGNYDAAFGTYALYGLTTGSYNFGGGYYAGKDLTTGSKNTFLGANTGHGITTGSSNTIIGANVTGLSSSLANNIILADGDGNQRLKIDSANNITFGAMTLVGSVAKGDIYYASDTNVLSKLSKPASTLYLTMDSDGVPAWAAGGAGGTVSVTAPLTGDGSAGDPLTVGDSLTSLAALSYASTAFVKMTAANTFALDTTVYVPLNGALGTPSSGTVTNLTGTASININGTVGATTPSTISATYLTVDNIIVDGNVVTSSSGDIRIYPPAGSNVAIGSLTENPPAEEDYQFCTYATEVKDGNALVSNNLYYADDGVSFLSENNFTVFGVANTKTQSGATGLHVTISRYYPSSDDNGTCNSLTGLKVSAGQIGTLSNHPTTLVRYGVIISGSCQEGTITDWYDLYIPAVNMTNGTMTNYYSIYQADTRATNFFGGTIFLGTIGDAFSRSISTGTNTLNIINGGAGSLPSGTLPNGFTFYCESGVGKIMNADGSGGSLLYNGGALGTPASGTVTNLTGTASININGTVGATTPAAGAFTTLVSTVSGAQTVSARFKNETATIRLTPYYDATYGSLIEALVAGEGSYVPMTLSGSKFIFNGGNVGIGTTSPSSKLEILGDNTSSGGITLYRGVAGTYGSTNLKMYNVGGEWIFDANNQDSTTSVVGNSYRFIHTGTDGVREDVFIQGTTGNVGIGTTSPTDKLTIYPVLSDTGTGIVTGNGILLKNTNSTAGNYTTIQNMDASGNQNAQIQFINVSHSSSGAIAFTTRSAVGEYAEKMRIMPGGNVGIGTTSPSAYADLTLSGSGAICLKETTTPTADADYGKVYTKNDNKLYFQDGAGAEHEISLAT